MACVRAQYSLPGGVVNQVDVTCVHIDGRGHVVSSVRATCASKPGQSISPLSVKGSRIAEMPVIERRGRSSVGQDHGPDRQTPFVTGDNAAISILLLGAQDSHGRGKHFDIGRQVNC